MKAFIQILISLLFLVGCDKVEKRRVVGPMASDKATSTSEELDSLKQRVKALELFASTYTAGVDNVFSDCNSLSVPLEKKICQVAQTATATQQMETKAQLATIAKEFQITLYGDNCTSEVAAGCPVAGSLIARITSAESDLSTAKSDISTIQGDITAMKILEGSLTTRVTALENRFDTFNGTASSIETIITGIQTDVGTLQTDVAAIQGVIVASKVLNQYLICGDNSVSGPVFELILISGDKTKAYGSIKNGLWYGLGLFFSAGNANLFTTTHLNTRACNFKMYNNVGNTKIQACWINSNRSATAAQIDAARTAATATCTDY